MKIIKIGRDSSCNIQLEHDMISRHHAILRIHQTGKIELISMGTNGTKLNGVLIRPNVVYKVKRSDMISFAGKHQLDWGMIPDPLKKYRIIGIALLVCALLGGLSMLGYKVYEYFNPEIVTMYEGSPKTPQQKPENPPTGTVKEEPTKKSETTTDANSSEKGDVTLSLEKIAAQQDSIKKVERQEKISNEKILNKIFPDKKKKAKTKKQNSEKKTNKEKTDSEKEKTDSEKEKTNSEKDTEKEAEDEKSDNSDDIKSKLIH